MLPIKRLVFHIKQRVVGIWVRSSWSNVREFSQIVTTVDMGRVLSVTVFANHT